MHQQMQWKSEQDVKLTDMKRQHDELIANIQVCSEDFVFQNLLDETLNTGDSAV